MGNQDNMAKIQRFVWKIKMKSIHGMQFWAPLSYRKKEHMRFRVRLNKVGENSYYRNYFAKQRCPAYISCDSEGTKLQRMFDVEITFRKLSLLWSPLQSWPKLCGTLKESPASDTDM